MTTDELTRLATLYYVDGLTQEDLSKQFSLSRAKIGRLLKRAQEEGIVEIRVKHHPRDTRDLERELISRFGIEKAIVSINHKDQDKQRELVAGLVASHLDQTPTFLFGRTPTFELSGDIAWTWTWDMGWKIYLV